MRIARKIGIIAAAAVCAVTASADSISVGGGTVTNPTDITARLLADQDLTLTGGYYVVRIPQSGVGVVPAISVDSRIASMDATGFSSSANPAIHYKGVIVGDGVVTVRSGFNASRPAYGQPFTGGALIFSNPEGQRWGVGGASSGGRSPSALIIESNASVEFFFPGESDRQTAGAPNAEAFPTSTTVSRNITNDGFLFSTTRNNWANITGTGISSFAYFGGDLGTFGAASNTFYSGQAFATANGLQIGGAGTIEDQGDGQPTTLVTRGLTVFRPLTTQTILNPTYSPSAPVKTVPSNMYNWSINIQLWNNGIHKFTGIFLPTTASKTFLDLAPVQDAVKGVYSYNGGGMAFGRVININDRSTLLMGDGREVVTNADGVTNNTWLQGNPFNTLLSTSNFVSSYPGRDAQALAYAYSGAYRVNHNFNAVTDAAAGIILRLRNPAWTNLYFLDPTLYNPAATKPNNPILTTAVFFAGLTRIDRNVVLQLGDGTVGNKLPAKTLTFSDGRTATFPYSDSGGNGMLMTKGNEAMLPKGAGRETMTANVVFEIANNGRLIVNNTPGALDATTAGASPEVAAWVSANRLDGITGSGSVEQRGKLALTLGGPNGNPNTYTGGTTIAFGATLIAGSATAFGARDAAAGGASGGVVNNGTLQAGGGVGTIVVPGDYTQPATADAAIMSSVATFTAATKNQPSLMDTPFGRQGSNTSGALLAGFAANSRRRRRAVERKTFR